MAHFLRYILLFEQKIFELVPTAKKGTVELMFRTAISSDAFDSINESSVEVLWT
jgi:hypothetical protein